MNLVEFVSKQLELLEIEKDAEIEENRFLLENKSIKDLAVKGVYIPKLRLSNSHSGLFGRTLHDFEPFWSGNSLPAHNISSGDIVGIGHQLSDGKLETLLSGIVTKTREKQITVATDKNTEVTLETHIQYHLLKLANDVTYRRLKRALTTLNRTSGNGNLVDCLFGKSVPSSVDPAKLSELTYFNKNLNDAQKQAVKFSLLQKEIAVIHGPPGTGKTTTVVETILQSVKQGLKVIACAPSNIAVDNLVEKLAKHKMVMVRLGHPARVLPIILNYTLDAVISRSNGSEVISDMHKELDELQEKIKKARSSGARKSMWAENKALLKEVKVREKNTIKDVLKNVDVVLCTLTSASDDGPLGYLPKNHFNVAVIDECSQALEASCWIPLLNVPKCVLAGDHHQLPPTIKSEKAAKDGLSQTLMERVIAMHGNAVKKMLNVQYRMHQNVMEWPSKQLYEDKLIAHESVASHLLKDLPEVEDNENTNNPLLFIDTAGCGLEELNIEDEDSKGNEGEADVVALYVKTLLNCGIKAQDIAVITPYNLQVDLIKSRLSEKYPKLEIKSVDGFQGREKEVVVLSLVRSNKIGEVGFLSEHRRINVAITRAKRHLAVIGDTKTVSCNPFLESLVNYMFSKGEVRSASQYEQDIGNYPRQYVKATVKPMKSTSENQTKKKGQVSKQAETLPSFTATSSSVPKLERAPLEEKYKEIIAAFITGSSYSMTFPTSLNSFERMIIHEVAESFGLLHCSEGIGIERHIKISKTDDSTKDKSSKSFNVLPDEHDTPLNDECVQSGLDYNKIAHITGECTQSGLDHHKTDDHRPEDKVSTAKPISKSVANKDQKTVKQKKSKSKIKPSPLEHATLEDDDFDALIQTAMKLDTTCVYVKCKNSIAMLLQMCQFCRHRFCLSHFIPEVHGCGDAAKKYARSLIRKEGKLYPGSGKPVKKVDTIAHAYLQRKMDKKLTELSSSRKLKSKS